MHKVTVKVFDLLDAMQDNLEKHRAEFEEGLEKYKEAVIVELERWLEAARDGKKVYAVTELRQPEDHTEDYKRVIRMAEMHTEDTIELTEQEFSQYVMDDWGWKKQFVTTMSSYDSYLND